MVICQLCTGFTEALLDFQRLFIMRLKLKFISDVMKFCIACLARLGGRRGQLINHFLS